MGSKKVLSHPVPSVLGAKHISNRDVWHHLEKRGAPLLLYFYWPFPGIAVRPVQLAKREQPTNPPKTNVSHVRRVVLLVSPKLFSFFYLSSVLYTHVYSQLKKNKKEKKRSKQQETTTCLWGQTLGTQKPTMGGIRHTTWFGHYFRGEISWYSGVECGGQRAFLTCTPQTVQIPPNIVPLHLKDALTQAEPPPSQK